MEEHKKFLAILKKCPLFFGIEKDDLSKMIDCLDVKIIKAVKNQVIFREGEPAKYVGILVSGSAKIVKEDYFGNRSIVAVVEPPEMFAESFACAGTDEMPVSVITDRDSQIMLLDCRRVLTTCGNNCAFHGELIKNLLHVIAEKNILLNQKIEIISKRTTREKLTAYLMMQAKKEGCNEFEIPYDRQELADYLGVERSAMSAEISKLRGDGVIECVKSRFKLL